MKRSAIPVVLLGAAVLVLGMAALIATRSSWTAGGKFCGSALAPAGWHYLQSAGAAAVCRARLDEALTLAGVVFWIGMAIVVAAIVVALLPQRPHAKHDRGDGQDQQVVAAHEPTPESASV